MLKLLRSVQRGVEGWRVVVVVVVRVRWRECVGAVRRVVYSKQIVGKAAAYVTDIKSNFSELYSR